VAAGSERASRSLDESAVTDKKGPGKLQDQEGMMINLQDQASGQLIGSITEEQLQF
jgi:hypothetical protein